jgi:mannose/fructose/N-acetylgalactosamine-specific phosphotransferase system component IIB
MKDIVLTRIDDRLIHGQVVTAWVKQTNGNRILIVDDPLSKDVFMQRIFKAAAPPNIAVEILTIEAACGVLKESPAKDERVIVLAKAPQTIERLLDSGIALGTVILGGMGAKATRKKFYKNVSAGDDEIACIKRIVEKGGSMQYQLVPDERPVDVRSILKEVS